MRRRWIYIVIAAGVASAITLLILMLLSGYAKSTPHSTSVPPTATVIPHNERQVVESYNQALTKQDWATIYASSTAWSGYTQEEFSHLMSQQVQKNGAIVSITPISDIAHPEIKTNADSLIYFNTIEKVVIAKNGISQTSTYVFTFILENGTWKFFTSKKL